MLEKLFNLVLPDLELKDVEAPFSPDEAQDMGVQTVISNLHGYESRLESLLKFIAEIPPGEINGITHVVSPMEDEKATSMLFQARCLIDRLFTTWKPLLDRANALQKRAGYPALMIELPKAQAKGFWQTIKDMNSMHGKFYAEKKELHHIVSDLHGQCRLLLERLQGIAPGYENNGKSC